MSISKGINHYCVDCNQKIIQYKFFFPTEFTQGKYWIKNFQLDGKKLVPWIPEGLWRGELIFNDKNDKEFLVIHVLVRVERGSMMG